MAGATMLIRKSTSVGTWCAMSNAGDITPGPQQTGIPGRTRIFGTTDPACLNGSTSLFQVTIRLIVPVCIPLIIDRVMEKNDDTPRDLEAGDEYPEKMEGCLTEEHGKDHDCTDKSWHEKCSIPLDSRA